MLEKLQTLGKAATGTVRMCADSFRAPAAVTGSAMQGSLDSPRLCLEEDVLNRHRIAKEIYRIICSQAANHSVRIGLFGDWGYGKTTIAYWVDAMAVNDKNVVVWFNPWSVQDLSELWLSFSIALRDALQSHKVAIPRWAEAKSTLARVRKRYAPLAESVNGGKVISDVAAAFLKFSKADIDALIKELHGRRVIVIIDDIDRADRKLLPQLLLSLRELLDVPGFAFLVPFEKSIVAEALLEQHGAWGSGERFLEKILDFQITIPRSTVDARWDLLAKHVADFMPTEALEQLKPLNELLPDNPRRIKRIARMFELVRHETARHKVDEVDWMSLLMGFMIKLESEEFFEKYVEETFRDTRARLSESVIQERDRREDAIQRRITDALTAADITDDELKERLKTLARRWEKERPYWHDARVIYTLRIFDLPDAFTWAEIDEVLAAWKNPTQLVEVQQVIARKAEALSRPSGAVAKELIESLAEKYHQHLEAAASAFSLSDHTREAASAEALIARIEPFILSDAVNLDNRSLAFDKLFDVYGTWSHFTTNVADAQLRVVEQRLLQRLLDVSGDHWQSYAAKLKPNDVFEKRELKEFVEAAKARFADRARDAALQLFCVMDGAFKILKREAPEMSVELLFDPVGALWAGNPGNAPMERLLSDAAQNPDIQRNAHRFLDMATGRHEVGMAISPATLREFLRNERPAIALWNAAISQPIQYRMLTATRAIRTMLISGGVLEDRLAFPDWLHAGEERQAEQG